MKNIDNWIIGFVIGSMFLVFVGSICNLEPKTINNIKFPTICPKNWCKVSETAYELRCKSCLGWSKNELIIKKSK
jgi:hypothetical protein